MRRNQLEYKRRSSKSSSESTQIDTQSTLTGQITDIYYQTDTCTIGRIRDEDAKSINFVCSCTLMVGDHITLLGNYSTHKKYGLQFQATSATTQMPIDMQGMRRYLATSPRFAGVGDVKAKILIDTFGDELPDVLANHPDKISEAIGITLDAATSICTAWGVSSGLNPLYTWLTSFGLTQNQCSKIVNSLSGDIQHQLTTNPYQLIDIVDGFGFSTVDAIAMKIGVSKQDANRIQQCILHVIKTQMNNGNTCVNEPTLLTEVERLLYLDCKDARELIKSQLAVMADDSTIVCLVDNRTGANINVYGLHNMHEYECYIVDICHRYGQRMRRDYIPECDDNTMNEYQRFAYRYAISSNLMILTGSAGTGKGYVINRACETLEQEGVSILMAAPTGKAAKRMEQQSTNPYRTASTIHRLLGYNPATNDWTYNKDNKLQADVVIIDEISMLDTELAYRLFSAVNFDKTRLILAGDENQIPSVGAGNILHDLIKSKLCHCVRLTEVMRQVGALERNATEILTKSKLAMTCDEMADGSCFTAETSKQYRPWTLAKLDDPAEIVATLTWLVLVKLPEFGYTINDIQILTPQNKGTLGTNAINRAMQVAIQGLSDETELSRRIYEGDRVMQKRNNYDRDIYNGTIGYVKYVGHDGVVISWEGKEEDESYDSGCEDLNDVQVAYATTVHKAQGSEYPVVIALVHKLHRYMNHRNLVYTAVTRASKCAIIIGDNVGMKSAMSKTDANIRDTFMDVINSRKECK